MKKIFLLIILVVSHFASAQIINQELGKAFIHDFLIAKNMEKSYAYFDEEVTKTITSKLLSETSIALEKQIGKFVKVLETNAIKENYFYYSEFEKAKLDIKISFNDNNKIIGFFFSPHKEFTIEKRVGKELSVKSGTLSLNGTLLNPETNNVKKLIIFVHGSGANDRDEKVNDNKPFLDIAESLYQKGIASYRFDKRTLSHPESFTDKSTIDDEVTNDVVNIVNYFHNNPEFIGYEITVLGHSLGAHVAPRIANKSADVSKIIMMAGNARPLEQLILEQYEYLNSLNPTDALTAEIEKVKKQIELLHSKKFDVNTPKENLPLEISASYWKSMLEYNPIKEIKKVKIPILILQGERDYQVTMVDFNLWKKALINNKKAKFVSYPTLNHLFISGSGKPNPTEYEIKGTVESKVINDIANFVSQ